MRSKPASTRSLGRPGSLYNADWRRRQLIEINKTEPIRKNRRNRKIVPLHWRRDCYPYGKSDWALRAPAATFYVQQESHIGKKVRNKT